jgi:hypothetical protein
MANLFYFHFCCESFVQAGGDAEFATKVTVKTRSGGVKKGYDLVRIGNINTIAFFHHRTTTLTAHRRYCYALIQS